MKKNYFIKVVLLLSVFLTNVAWAQERTVTGKVTSIDDGSPIPGVNVVIKGTTNGTTTDADGAYKLSMSSGGVLVFSFIGLKTEEAAIGERTIVDIGLSQDVSQLSEVVVVGYSTVQKRELTGAVSSVSGEVIKNLPVQTLDRALQGRSAGVQVLSANGAPGSAVSVRIRGTGSILAGNDPLYIVDGVQLNTRNDGGSRVSNNPLAFLNPNDIESIDILKDAANASIYGAQAANGVVIVTTKKGKAGQKARFELNYYKGIVDPVPTIDVLSTQEFIQVRQEALQIGFPTLTPLQIRQATLAGLTSPTITITGLGLPSNLTDEQIATLPNYDWQGEAFKRGSIDNYDLSMSGGDASTTFYSSVSCNKQQSSVINVDFERFAGKLNLGHKINKKISVDLGINLSTVKQRGPFGDARGTTAFGAPQYASPVILPLNPIYNEKGEYFGLPASPIGMVGDLSQNVIANANYIKSLGRTNQLVGSFALNYKIMNDLTFKAFGGLDYRALYGEFYGDPRLTEYYTLQGTQSTFNSNNLNLSTNYTLNYLKSFGKHNVNGLAGFEYRQEVNDGNSFSGQGFPSPDFSTSNAAATPTGVGGFWTGFKREGVFGNFKYDYDKKYILSLTMRYDGSSRFGDNHRFGFFPSISGAWNIFEEGFLKDSDVVSDLKLRASWGTTGNDQIGNFDARSLYGLGTSSLGTAGAGSSYNGAAGITPSQMGNPDLRWEKNETINIGLDYGFFNNRVSGSVEVFRRTSRDLLLNQSLPQTSGFSSITKNVGELRNEGFEFELRTVNLDVSGFKWETNFNITLLRNKVLSLFDGLQVLPGNLGIRVGYPLGTNTGNPYAGVNPANGRPMHYDINGNLTYLRVAADIVPLGHQDFSSMYGGFTNTFAYKNFELSAFIQYDYGRTVANLQNFRMADLGGVLRNSNVMFYNDRWTTPGQITSVPRPANNRAESTRISSYQIASRFYEDASFIRLKQVTLSYNIPQNLLTRFKISNAKVYAQGGNLVTWTKWTGYDPEFRDSGNGSEGIIPQVKNYTFGVQLGF